ncbi:hypothetical protein BU17DRAFT_81783 [Hysterangium stoloniferum]|nr:hypothetical protein BU17DRAFT_81783 [Hysterangium stoloniferum]
MSTPSLPSYAGQPGVPPYTAQPRRDEQTLGRTRVPPPNSNGTRVWTKKAGTITLSLPHQPVHAELPVYGRETDIQGYLTLESTHHAVAVTVKLHGYVKCKTIAEIGQSNFVVLDLPVVLWRKDSGIPCPNVLPFQITLPSTYSSNGRSGPMPPSFAYTFYDLQGGTPGLKAKIKYEIIVEIDHVHTTLKDKLGPALSTEFTYLPRTRPARAPSSTPSSVFKATMERRVGGKSRFQDPIVWKLCLPPPGTYAIAQSIPFRVSVACRTSSLLAPFAPSNKDNCAIRVYVLRQVSINVNSVPLWRSYVIGEGKLTYASAPDDTMWLKNVLKSEKGDSESMGSDSEHEGWASHNWTGAVKINDGISVGGFQIENMAVKDFFVLSAVPPNPRLGELLEAKRVVSIQLTTEAYSAEGSYAHPVEAHANPEAHGYLEGQENGHHLDSNGHGVANNIPRNGNAA